MAESSSSFRLPSFCRHMNKADEFIMCIPDDAAFTLWGEYKCPTNVDIITEDGRKFNVGISASKDDATFKLTSFLDGVSHGTFWTFLLPPSAQFYVIPECILPKHYDYSSNDVIATVITDNITFNVLIKTFDGKVGFSAGIDVIVSQLRLIDGCFMFFTKSFGNFFHLKVFGKNGVEMKYSDVDVDEADVAPLDAEDDDDEEINGGVKKFVRMAGEDHFRIPDPVSRMARLHEGLKDLTVRFSHLDPPLQITNGTRRERRERKGKVAFRYALTSWKKFLKAGMIKLLEWSLEPILDCSIRMEQPAITLLKNLNLNQDDYTIKVRIVRLWSRAAFNDSRKVYCYDMILMDEVGTKIQAFVLAKTARDYEHLLKEKQCLFIRNPSLGENRQKVKYVHISTKINLNTNAIVSVCDEPVGTEWGFDFSPFSSIVQDPTDDNKSFRSPIDVIGFVVKSFPYDLKEDTKDGKQEKKLTFMLQDLEGKQIYVTLWDAYAEQILDFERDNQDEKNVVVIVQFGKYRFWGGFLYVSNLYTVTRVLINAEIDDILTFKRRFLSNMSPETSSTFSGLSASRIKDPTEEYLSDFEFSTIGSLNQISEKKFVIIVGTIKSFASEDSWFYNACRNCNRAVTTKTISKEKQDGSDGFEDIVVLECKDDGCNSKTVYSVPRIRVPIRVQDCTGIVTLTLFEREVVRVLKVNATQLLDKNLDLANEGNFPQELNALLNRKFAFKISIGSFNITKKSDGYSISKLTDNQTVIGELDKIFDVIQPVDEERVNAVSSDIHAAVEVPVNDSVSRSKADDTPVSNFNKDVFKTPDEDVNGTSIRVLENDLKRNLDSIYDDDVMSSQSSTKPRKAGKEVVIDECVTAGLLIPKVEK
ncbi:putative transcription factor B3-Domain family [Helianthus annuus]|nr:putative transcription factor B3-Domain family [Helianthus annuus]KAJ0633430.1 putative transcription factor B3-Domain family [Helianthus annuus]